MQLFQMIFCLIGSGYLYEKIRSCRSVVLVRSNCNKCRRSNFVKKELNWKQILFIASRGSRGQNNFCSAEWIISEDPVPCIISWTFNYSASHDNWCTATLWNRIMTAQCEGMGEVGSARYEPSLLPSCPSISVLNYSNCQEIHSRQKSGLAV